MRVADHRNSFVVGTVLITLLIGGGHANAAQQGITGKKFLLKTNPKMVLLSTDALVVPGAPGSSSDPRCVADGGGGSGASVELDDGTNSVTLTMPCANWVANGSGSRFKYRDATDGWTTAKVKAGRLSVRSSAAMSGLPIPSGPATVKVTITLGADSYCMTFSGTGDGSKFLVKDTTAGTCGAPTPTPTVTTTKCENGPVCAPTCGQKEGDPCCACPESGLLFCCSGPCVSDGHGGTVCGGCGEVGEACCPGNICNGVINCCGGYCTSDTCGQF